MKNKNQTKENWIEKIKCKRENHEDQLCGGCEDCQASWSLKSLMENQAEKERQAEIDGKKTFLEYRASLLKEILPEKASEEKTEIYGEMKSKKWALVEGWNACREKIKENIKKLRRIK